MTPSNRMVHINKELFEDRAWDPAKLKIFEAGDHRGGGRKRRNRRGQGEDHVYRNHRRSHGQGGGRNLRRQAGEVDVSIVIIDQADLSKLHAYLAFSRPPATGTGESGQVSGTAYIKVP